MDDGALDDALEAGRRLRILSADGDQIGELGVDVFDQAAAQLVEVDIAGPHDRRGVLVIDEGQQEMLERRVFLVRSLASA